MLVAAARVRCVPSRSRKSHSHEGAQPVNQGAGHVVSCSPPSPPSTVLSVSRAPTRGAGRERRGWLSIAMEEVPPAADSRPAAAPGEAGGPMISLSSIGHAADMETPQSCGALPRSSTRGTRASPVAAMRAPPLNPAVLSIGFRAQLPVRGAGRALAGWLSRTSSIRFLGLGGLGPFMTNFGGGGGGGGWGGGGGLRQSATLGLLVGTIVAATATWAVVFLFHAATFFFHASSCL